MQKVIGAIRGQGGSQNSDLRDFNFALFSLLILIIHGILHELVEKRWFS